jgi:hypothetical protein
VEKFPAFEKSSNQDTHILWDDPLISQKYKTKTMPKAM